MRIISIFSRWPNRQRRAESRVGGDADALMSIWGETAHAVAADLSWREDSGLMHSTNPGHWGRVHREIGRRLGVADGPVFERSGFERSGFERRAFERRLPLAA